MNLRHIAITTIAVAAWTACDGESALVHNDDPCVVAAGRLTGDLVLTRDCAALRIIDDLVVADGHTLTIPSGSELIFDPGVSLIVGDSSPGKLVALGRPNLPIRFLGVTNPDGFAAKWGGIVFEGGTVPSSVLSHVVVDGGGETIDDEIRGCVTVRDVKDDALVLTDLTLVSCAGPGLVLDAGRVGPVENLVVQDTEVGVRVPASNVADIPTDANLSGAAVNELLGGMIETDATVRPLGQLPWRVDDDIVVAGPEGPTLTVEAGTELRFPAGRWLSIAPEEPGALIVAGRANAIVHMRSMQTMPGAWHGVVIGPETTLASIEYATIHYGGAEGTGVRGCLSLHAGAEATVRLSAVEIGDCEGAGIGTSESADFVFTELAETSIARSPVGVSVPANIVGSLGVDLAFDDVNENVILGGQITRNASWIPRSIPWLVSDDVGVGGPTLPWLTLERGLELEFAPDKWLSVGLAEPGGLNVAGTSDKRVVLRSRGERGWRGIVVGPETLHGSTIDYAAIESGGAMGPNVGGCISVTSREQRRLSIAGTQLVGCHQAGVAVSGNGFSFERFEANSFVDCELGLVVVPSAVASISTDQTYDRTRANLILEGSVTQSGRWGAGKLPWRVTGPVSVDGDTAPELHLSSGLRLEFERGGSLAVGTSLGGSLRSIGEPTATVVLTSANTNPMPGAWSGLTFGPAAGPSRVERTRVSFAEKGIELMDTAANVWIAESGFGSNSEADVFVDCGSQPRLENNNYGSPNALVYQDGCQ